MRQSTYYIFKDGKTLGPLLNWEVLDLFDRGEVGPTDKMCKDDPDVAYATTVKDSRLYRDLPRLRAQIKMPANLQTQELIYEIRELQDEIGKVKWAVRIVGFIIVGVALGLIGMN